MRIARLQATPIAASAWGDFAERGRLDAAPGVGMKLDLPGFQGERG